MEDEPQAKTKSGARCMKSGLKRKETARFKRDNPYWALEKIRENFVRYLSSPNQLFKWASNYKSKHTKRKISRGYVVARKLDGNAVTFGGRLDASPASSD